MKIIVPLPLNTSVINARSDDSFLIILKSATVEIFTYWSLSICETRNWSVAKLSLEKYKIVKNHPIQIEIITDKHFTVKSSIRVEPGLSVSILL